MGNKVAKRVKCEIGFSIMDSYMMGGGSYSFSRPADMSFEDMVEIYIKELNNVLTNGKWVFSDDDVDDLFMLENKISKIWTRISIKDANKKYCFQYYSYDTDKEYSIPVRQTIISAMNIIDPI